MPHAEFIDEHHLRVNGLDFFCTYEWGREKPTPAGFFSVQKDQTQIKRYLELFERFRPEVIVELGIRQGGSTALLHALCDPQKLVAIELEHEPTPALSAYIKDHRLESVGNPHYGINQADRQAVAAIMAQDLQGRQIDIVIDDASHLYQETRSSFETLFPLLRPGGLYVIEDWNSDHLLADRIEAVLADPGHPEHAGLKVAIEQEKAKNRPPDPRLVRLPLELVLARASSRDAIREVVVMNNWIVITRGDEAVDAASFQFGDLVKDHFSNLEFF